MPQVSLFDWVNFEQQGGFSDQESGASLHNFTPLTGVRKQVF